jgi:hypothetical protein
MNALIRLALTLTVAAAASLTPVASADVVDPLDNGGGAWQSSDGGTTRFYYGGQKFDWWWGQYTIYPATHTHADGFQMEMMCTYWHDYGVVTFSYVHGPDRGQGEWTLSSGRDTAGHLVTQLVGGWESKKGFGSGKWNLWRRQ